MNQSDSSLVGHFLHEIAMNCNTRFKDGATSVKPKCAYSFLYDEQGYDCEYEVGTINVAKVCVNLANGHPHIIAGKDQNKDNGHAWIIDGSKYVGGELLLHNVWGSGNGYGDSWTNTNYFVYNPGNSTIYCINFIQIYINSTTR